MVDQRTPNGIPPDAIAPGAILLLFDLAKFMKQTGTGNPTEKDIQDAMPILKGLLTEIFSKHGKGAKPQQNMQPSANQPTPQQPQGLIGAAMGGM